MTTSPDYLGTVAPQRAFKIRLAKLHDLPGVVSVLSEGFYPQQGWRSLASPLLRLGLQEDLRQRLKQKRPQYACFVAVHHGQDSRAIVGTVEVAIPEKDPWRSQTTYLPYIANLAVAPAVRRQGIAHQLLQACEDQAQQWHFPHISLHVMEDNHPARQLYGQRGYRLQRLETDLWSWVWRSPRKFLLKKALIPPSP